MFYILLFIIADLISLIFATRVIGLFNVMFCVLLVALGGLWVITNQGWMTIARLQNSTVAGQEPTKALVRSLLVLLGGVLLLVPGFFSDALALLLFFPPTGSLVGLYLRRKWINSAQNFIFFRSFNSGPNDSSFESSYRPMRDVTPDRPESTSGYFPPPEEK